MLLYRERQNVALPLMHARVNIAKDKLDRVAYYVYERDDIGCRSLYQMQCPKGREEKAACVCTRDSTMVEMRLLWCEFSSGVRE